MALYEFPLPYRWLAAALDQLGGIEEAKQALEGSAAAVAFLAGGGPMNEEIDDSGRRCLLREDVAPFAEGLVVIAAQTDR